MTMGLTACGVIGPNFQKPVIEPPAQWTHQPNGTSPAAASVPAMPSALPANRWAAFGDAELLLLQALSTQANADVKVAALRLLQSRVNESTVSAQRGPRLDARGGVSRQRQSESGSATRVAGALGSGNQQPLIDVLSAPFALYQAGFDASWEPDLWGRVARSEEVAKASSDAQQALLRQVHLSVASEVARYYFELRSVQQQSRLVQEELTLAQELERVLIAQQRGGLVDESAVIGQQSRVTSLEALLPALDAQETQAMNQIALLCGTRPGDLREQLSAQAPPAAVVQLPDLRLGLPSEIVRHRPDVSAAEAALHAATANIGLAMADLYPRITLGASFGQESVNSNKFGEWGSRQWTVGPSLNIPIFDNGRRHSIVTLRELQQQESAVAYQQVVLKAWHEVDNAIADYLAQTQRRSQLEKKVNLAQAQVKLDQARFAHGLSNVVPVSSSDMALLETRRDLVESQGQLNTSLTALYKALGDDSQETKSGKPLQNN